MAVAAKYLDELARARPTRTSYQARDSRRRELTRKPLALRQEAQRPVYSLFPEPLAEVDEWLGRYRALWEQRLDALHTEVARGKRERRRTR